MPGQNAESPIVEVWANNLTEEFAKISEIIEEYNYVAMDTEFPGVVARPIGEFRTKSDYQYQLLRCNVDMLKVIQLGFTFLNKNGETPPGTSTWQFNFKFNLAEDMYAQDSIDLLHNAGIQFKKHEQYGIDPMRFGASLYGSGIILMGSVNWISYHSGYDFGYMLKLVSNNQLPEDEKNFFERLNTYFGKIYDIKHLIKNLDSLKGGLQDLSDTLQIPRVGQQHQAGSDSLLTGTAFFKIQEKFFNTENNSLDRHAGQLYGLGNHQAYGSPYSAEEYAR